MTFEEIIQQLKERQYNPVYFLMGEEPYFIDRITDYIAGHVLSEEEKTFNQTILYGKDSEAGQVSDLARRFPMMASHQVVIVKEAQELKYALQEVVRSGATPIDRLKDYIRFRLYHVKTVSNFYEAMKDESNVKMEFVAKIRKRFEEQEYKMLKEILDTGIDEGAFKLTDSGIVSPVYSGRLVSF